MVRQNRSDDRIIAYQSGRIYEFKMKQKDEQESACFFGGFSTDDETDRIQLRLVNENN
jgi:hypothetical protein